MIAFVISALSLFIALNIVAYFFSEDKDLKLYFFASLIYGALSLIPMSIVSSIIALVGMYAVFIITKYKSNGLFLFSIISWAVSVVLNTLVGFVFIAKLMS